MKRELNILLTAFMFFTRIPVRLIGKYDSSMLNSATKYLPLVGYVVSFISASIFYISNMYFSIEISLVVYLISSVLITGAFHEDGLADTFDAFGGGWTKEKKLEIMKDSRIGTYGSLALILAFLLKFTSLNEIDQSHLIYAIFFSQVLSRLAPVVLVFSMQYVRLDESSKVKPVGEGISIKELMFALASSSILFFIVDVNSLIITPVLLVSLILLGLWFKKHLGGYTGDALGASQQLCELIILLSLTVLWN